MKKILLVVAMVFGLVSVASATEVQRVVVRDHHGNVQRVQRVEVRRVRRPVRRVERVLDRHGNIVEREIVGNRNRDVVVRERVIVRRTPFFFFGF